MDDEPGPALILLECRRRHDRVAVAFVVLYGGANSSGRLQDMWRWDGARWEEISLAGPTPGPRITPGMAYDKHRQKLVLYGGFGTGPALQDTWEWDGRVGREIKGS